MDFRISDTFTDSLARLTNDEQKAVKTTAFDLQVNPTNPGMSFHRVDRAKDENFWSVRVNRDLRLIVHRTKKSFLLCYVAHHDDAYVWAERRRIERHPATGAAQIVEVRETVVEVPIYVQIEQEIQNTPLFANVSDADLLKYGVPGDWLDTVREVTEDSILDVADHLPAEAAEALLDLAIGRKPPVTPPVTAEVDPFEHPDAQRRFRTVEGREELERALGFPWERWAVFLHPAQRSIVTRPYSGPARVAGSAGTGKTVVALHRAVHLAEENPDSRTLLTTFSDPLARALKNKLRTLVMNRPRHAERIDVEALDAAALRLHRAAIGPARIATVDEVATTIAKAAAMVSEHGFTQTFLLAEWRHVVDAWQLRTWEEYRDVPRLGRKTRLPQSRREALWDVFDQIRRLLSEQSLVTLADVFGALSDHYRTRPSPFDFVVVDEAQDVSVAQLRFLAALAGKRPDGLFFAGDLGQRIFQPPFSWAGLGVDVRGRSKTLRINYRTSHQIRRQADRLLGPEIADVDGISEDRRGTVSVFNGPDPIVRVPKTEPDEIETVAGQIRAWSIGGIPPEEIGVFVRSDEELGRAIEAVEQAAVPYRILNEQMLPGEGRLSIGTMHLAKGLEFRAVVVMACDDEVIPHQARIEEIGDDADLEEVYNTERHLLYVACTRAREQLLVSGVYPGSEFLEDFSQVD
jgi:mRNA-degrading endonuclease RelE of RelBE toxin-antitoxin system